MDFCQWYFSKCSILLHNYISAFCPIIELIVGNVLYVIDLDRKSNPPRKALFQQKVLFWKYPGPVRTVWYRVLPGFCYNQISYYFNGVHAIIFQLHWNALKFLSTRVWFDKAINRQKLQLVYVWKITRKHLEIILLCIANLSGNEWSLLDYILPLLSWWYITVNISFNSTIITTHWNMRMQAIFMYYASRLKSLIRYNLSTRLVQLKWSDIQGHLSNSTKVLPS